MISENIGECARVLIHFVFSLCYGQIMGGYGSGRKYGAPLAEEALRIDFAWMLRTNRASEGYLVTGGLHWTCGGEPSGDISYTCDMRDLENATLQLRFITGAKSGNRQDHVQNIRLSYTVPNYGGRRWWMHCPFTGARVGKLFVPAGAKKFASRKAWRIAYKSQRDAPRDKPFSAMFKLQKRLGCEQGWGGFIRRPKGMWHSTYAKHEERYDALEHRCNIEMLAVLGILKASLKK